MSKNVEFWFDYGSPASHLGYWGLKQVAKRTGASVTYRPMLLGAVFKATGNHTPMDITPKGEWMFVDFQNYAERYGIQIHMNQHFIFNTLAIMRGALVAQERKEIEPYSDAMFNAVWVDGKNMSDPEIIGGVLDGAGLDAVAYSDGVQKPDIKEGLKTASEEAVSKGVFGAPTFFVNDKMWFGQDRLEWVEDALRK